MKIFFTHGYFIAEDAQEQRIMRPYPPLGVLYLSAWLEQYGFENEVFDTTFSTKENLHEYLNKNQPHIIAVYTNLVTKINVLKIIQWIRSNPLLNNSLVVLGGPDISYNIVEYLDAKADVLVVGEGEQTMLEIVQTVAKGNRSEFAHIQGLAYKLSNGEIFQTTPRQRLKEIDLLPFPNRKKIQLELYLQAWKKKHGLSAISVSTQRGCPYTCQWCSTAVYGQSYRRRSPQNVVDELLLIKEQYNPDTLWFVDDVFTVSHQWLKGFQEEIEKRNALIPFECITRADRLNEEVILLLKKAGAFRVWIGAESGSQKIIDAMDRRVEVEQVQKMIQLAQQHGIEAGTFIMLGYPNETMEDIEATVQHLKNANPSLFTITIAYPIKGTKLYEQVENLQLKTLDWTKTTDRERDFKRTFPRPFYDFAVRYVVNEVHYHQSILKNNKYNALKFKLKSLVAKWGMYWWKNKN